MTSREIDQAATRLRELKQEMLGDGLLAACALGLALGATWYRPSLAVPLTVGALAMTFLGTRAYVRRFLIVDELADDRDAYCIPAIRGFGRRAASVAHRRELARRVRAALEGSTGAVGGRFSAARPDLEHLISALEDEKVEWEPQAVVLLDHWLSDPDGSFRNSSLPAAEIRSRISSLLPGVEVDGRREDA